ncbi:MAG: cupin domain-containing protein [Geobacter sp.]|nr:cupin domain-containing protein [Geobacter sp.]
MKTQVIDVKDIKKFDDAKRHQETIFSDDHARITLICMKPGQEIITHTHHGSHIWTVMEGAGELVSGKQSRTITMGQVVVVPAFEDHGIRNSSSENLVIVSITGQGD